MDTFDFLAVEFTVRLGEWGFINFVVSRLLWFNYSRKMILLKYILVHGFAKTYTWDYFYPATHNSRCRVIITVSTSRVSLKLVLQRSITALAIYAHLKKLAQLLILPILALVRVVLNLHTLLVLVSTFFIWLGAGAKK